MTPAETKRMVSEKVAATQVGSLQGARAVARLAARRARVPTPASLINDMVSIAEVATRPARRRVKANAVRLNKPSSPSKPRKSS